MFISYFEQIVAENPTPIKHLNPWKQQNIYEVNSLIRVNKQTLIFICRTVLGNRSNAVSITNSEDELVGTTYQDVVCRNNQLYEYWYMSPSLTLLSLFLSDLSLARKKYEQHWAQYIISVNNSRVLLMAEVHLYYPLQNVNDCFTVS